MVASSADGTRLLVAAGANAQGHSGPIVLSIDSGATWSFNGSPSGDWSSVAASADGNKLAAAANGGGIWILQSTAAPALSIARANGNLVVSWTVPSTVFVLQENPDLNTTNWTDVMNTPVLSFTNLQNQVTAPAPAVNRFYRLKQSATSGRIGS